MQFPIWVIHSFKGIFMISQILLENLKIPSENIKFKNKDLKVQI